MSFGFLAILKCLNLIQFFQVSQLFLILQQWDFSDPNRPDSRSADSLKTLLHRLRLLLLQAYTATLGRLDI